MLETYMQKTPYRGLKSFEEALRRDGLLHEEVLKPHVDHTTILYASMPPEKWNPYQVAQALCPAGYFCNLSSVYYHGLTNQVPSRMYVAVEGNRENDHRQATPPELSDDDIFTAFMQPHRVTKRIVVFQKREIVITERVGRDCMGVETVHADNRICPKGSRVTGIERTILDAVVLPQYNGGLRTTIDVLRKGFRRANQRRLLDLYEGLAYVYPYWQALGFLTEKLGELDLAAAIARKYKAKHKFYLDHGAKTSWEFDAKWQIYYPKGVI